MKKLRTFLIFKLLLTIICAYSDDTNLAGYVNQHVKLTVACSNSVFQTPTNISLSIGITNNSTNVVGVGAPICDFDAFEIWLIDGAGSSTNIVTKRKVKGPGASASGMNFIYQIYPKKSAGCILTVPLGPSIRPDKHILTVKRLCIIITLDSNGKVVSSPIVQLISNPFDIEIIKR